VKSPCAALGSKEEQEEEEGVNGKRGTKEGVVVPRSNVHNKHTHKENGHF